MYYPILYFHLQVNKTQKNRNVLKKINLQGNEIEILKKVTSLISIDI